MSDKLSIAWAVAFTILGLAWVAGCIYGDTLNSRERQLCISSGGEPGLDHKCTRVPPLVKDK